MKIHYHPASTVKRWLGKMKALKSWGKVNEVINGYVASLKGQFEKV